jgi:two-component system OmpR family sensor kinase
MSLITRLSTFFLTGLALILLGFSAVLFLLMRYQLAERVHQRLATAMQTIVAAIEIHPDDVEWEPLERHVALGEDPGDDQVRWMIHDASGHLVDCSRNLESERNQGGAARDPQFGDDWRILIRRVRAGRLDPEEVDESASPDDGIAPQQLPGEATLPSDRTYHGPALTIRVAIPWYPLAASLRQLAWTLAGVSVGLWSLGALLSRLVCRRALRPVVRMAASARALRAEESGQFLAVAGTGDELEDLGRAFNDVLTRLREVLERQQRFTGDASHQLRTPLTAILGQVEVALLQERSPGEYQRVLQIVKRRAGDMRQTVELLLFLARMPVQTELPETQVLNLADWLADYQRQWEDHPRAADIHWPTSADGEVRTQPALLRQLFDNLLDNACKYSDPGTPIPVAIEKAWRGVTLIVTDRGLGIGPEDLPHLCDPFYRSAEARRLGRPGVGLGLTVVQRIVHVLGGELRIESKLGQGSQFRLYLPTVRAEFAVQALENGKKQPSSESAEVAQAGNHG